jgi:C-terminal processing protease CtpA/Prc
MAACPNCQSYVLDGQLFCRSCGFCMDHGFQVSTRSLGLPSTGPQQGASTQPVPRARTCYKPRHRFSIPIAGFVLALLVGGLSAAPFMSMNNYSSHHSCGQSSQAFLSERSYMGVYLVENYDGSSGAYIDAVLEGSPADQAGLASGDRIISVNDGLVSTIPDLVSHLKRTAPGTTITLRVEREDETFYTALTTTRRSELNFQARRAQGFLGVGDLDTITIGEKTETYDSSNAGVLVGRVIDNSAAEFSGLQSGDVILSVDGHSTETPQQLARRVRATTPQQIVPILVWRDGQVLHLSASMGER